MNVRDIVRDWLKKNDYDGLCHPDRICGCSVDELMPCSFELVPGCVAGHQVDSSEFDYEIVPGRKE